MTTRKTLRDFLQTSLGSGNSTISYKITKSGQSAEGDDLDIDVVSGKKLLDFNDPNNGMLGDYVNFITKKNVKQINPGVKRAASSQVGNASFTNPDEIVNNPHVPQGTPENSKMAEYSNSGYFDADLGNSINKINNDTASAVKSIQGQPLDKSGFVVSNQQGEDNPIIQLSQQMLIQNNRFSPTTRNKAFRPTSITTQEFESKENISGTTVIQNTYAAYDKDKHQFSLDSAKKIGKSLLLKAGGWDTSQNPKDSADPDNFTLANSIVTKSGVSKVSIPTVRSKNAAGFPEDSQGNSVRLGKGESTTELRNEAFGSIFNDKMHFFGTNFELLKTQAAIAIIAVRKSLEVLLNQLENLAIKSRKKDNIFLKSLFAENTEIYGEGSYQPEAIESIDFIKKKLLIKTTYSYFDCVDVGIRSLFEDVVLSDENEESVKNKSNFIKEDSYFWISVFVSALKRTGDISRVAETFSNDTISNSVLVIEAIKNNAMIRLMNMFATIGDIELKSKRGKTGINVKNIRDVDSYPSLPSTRVSKSKSGVKSKRNLAWSDMHLPSAYLLPLNVIGATIDMNTVKQGTNPSRGMLGSSLADKTYTGMDAHGSFNRIPIEVVREIEDRLEAEYVPFYIQDIRTNEIIAFNAFLSTLTDQIGTNYNDATGYGRIDSVKVYNNTSRTVTVGFTLLSTNPQDYDQMWYKINKLVTLFYPQWTEGDTITKGTSYLENIPIVGTAGDAVFKQPFSQVIGATPLVRMRVGDVIKSNYSKFNLSRVFGAGDIGTNLRPTSEIKWIDSLLKATNVSGFGINIPGIGRVNLRDALVNRIGKQIGSPISSTAFNYNVAKAVNNLVTKENIVNNVIDLMSSTAIQKMAVGLANGFINQLVLTEVINKLVDPSLTSNLENEKFGYMNESLAFVRIKHDKPYTTVAGEDLVFNRRVKVKVKKRQIKNLFKKGRKIVSDFNNHDSFTEYTVEINDENLSVHNGKKFKVTHSDLEPDYNEMFLNGLGKKIDELNIENNATNGITQKIKNSENFNKNDNKKSQADFMSMLMNGPESFMNSFFNPVTRAFESNMGRGLAGTLGGVTFDWLSDFGWGTDFNCRAPMGVNISLTLSVMHDIPPGIDHSGYNRAPLYNVGNIMNEISGDPNDRADSARENFNLQENLIQKSRK